MTDQPQRRPPRGSEQGLVVDVADTLGGRELITLDKMVAMDGAGGDSVARGGSLKSALSSVSWV